MDDAEYLRERLEILDAILRAGAQRDDVLATVASAESEEEAVASLAERLGITRLGADSVLSMQMRRFTPAAQEKVRRERDELVDGLGLADGADDGSE